MFTRFVQRLLLPVSVLCRGRRSAVAGALLSSAQAVTYACAADVPDLRRPSGAEPAPQGPTIVLSDSDAGRGADAGTPSGASPPAPSSSTPQPYTPLEPMRDGALTVVHGVVDAAYVYFCDLEQGTTVRQGARPMPEGGLAYSERWIIPQEQLDLERGLSWLLVAASERVDEALDCAALVQRAEALAGSDTSDVPSAGPGMPQMSESADDGVPEPAEDGRNDAGAVWIADAAAPGSDAALGDAIAQGVPAIDAAIGIDAGHDRQLDAAAPKPDPGVPTGVPPADAAAPRVSIPAIRVAPFVQFTGASLAPELSRLIVAVGCVGGYPEVDEALCGEQYAVTKRSLKPLYFGLSRRTQFRALGLQFVNASELPGATLRSAPTADGNGMIVTIGASVLPGQITPEYLLPTLEVSQFGEPLSDATLQVELSASGESRLETTWGDVLAQAGMELPQNGDAISFVYLGPSLTLNGWSQFNRPSLLLLDNDPKTPAADP